MERSSEEFGAKLTCVKKDRAEACKGRILFIKFPLSKVLFTKEQKSTWKAFQGGGNPYLYLRATVYVWIIQKQTSLDFFFCFIKFSWQLMKMNWKLFFIKCWLWLQTEEKVIFRWNINIPYCPCPNSYINDSFCS